MIALTSNSNCDICLEGYGQDPEKVPCALQCGHIFCCVCLPHVPGHLCPLCRTPYISFVKLHLDVDGASRGSPATPPLGATQAEEAQKLLGRFDKAIDRGCSEAELTGLLEECKVFLKGQPRSMFSELRTIKRLMCYLHKVKANLVAQTQAINLVQSEIDQLRAEKEDLERRLKELKSARKLEKRAAHSAEKALRDHCSRAHAAYEAVVDQYNFVVQEWMRLQNEFSRMQMPPTPQPELATPDLDMEPDLAKTPQPRFVAELDQTKLKQAVVQDPSSFLISPLPQFTGQLPEALLLPDEDELQDTQRGTVNVTFKASHQEQLSTPFQSFQVPSTPSSNCDSSGHPWTCNCQEVSLFANGKVGTPRPPITSTVSTPVLPTKAKSPLQTPNPTSAALLSPGRHRSHTIATPTSRPPSRASSPKPRSNGSVRGIYSPASTHSSLSSREPESLKSRLHDLLQDNSGISSSLPNMSSSHFPTSLTRETPHQTPRPELSRPSSHSGTTPPQHRVNPVLTPNHGESEQARVSPPMNASYVAPATPTTHSVPSPPPAPVISRASNAAMVIEKERKEKKEQERERRRAEKDKQRLAEAESLGRSNSVSSATSASGVSSIAYSRWDVHSGRESTSHTSQRLTSASGNHRSAPVPTPSPSIYT
ncbi:hypothetical protein D9756_007064 [Leucocoprinus leucothites]|uniref:RING-type domain-containing protein n=1 Tax=Leucocoprinus leucothites TaxID=201217 RepID=A0A8H5FYD4_9AGAR|nr:hypothetical protein D9756_007064 [Leucoagaricus leucothites]